MPLADLKFRKKKHVKDFVLKFLLKKIKVREGINLSKSLDDVFAAVKWVGCLDRTESFRCGPGAGLSGFSSVVWHCLLLKGMDWLSAPPPHRVAVNTTQGHCCCREVKRDEVLTMFLRHFQDTDLHLQSIVIKGGLDCNTTVILIIVTSWNATFFSAGAES